MKKMMIITLGTGSSVEHGISASIEVHNPDEIIFIATENSQVTAGKVQETLQRRAHQEMPPHALMLVTKESSVDDAYCVTRDAIEAALRKGYARHHIFLDFTSGTKAMSVGAGLAALLAECQKMVYIGGKNRDAAGRVMTGYEEVTTSAPSNVFADYKLRLVKQLFNVRQFDACLRILLEAQERIRRDDLAQFEQIVRAYERWDKFDHAAAHDYFQAIPNSVKQDFALGKNEGFVAQIAKKVEKKQHAIAILPEHIIDLFANAARRGEEGKYDDAVARLYRATEMIAQYRLHEGVNLSSKGIQTSNVDPALLPEALRPKYEALRKSRPGKAARIALGLEQAYLLIADLGDAEFAERYLENRVLLDQLSRRNASILAHGLFPVGEDVYRTLKAEVIALIRATIPNADEHIERATMMTFPGA